MTEKSAKSYGAPPEFDPIQFPKWTKLMMGHLIKYVGVVQALESPEPEVDDKAFVKTLHKGQKTDKTTMHVQQIAKKKRKWIAKNEKGYSFIMESCKNHPIALQIVLTNERRNGQEVMHLLKERFQIQSTRIQQVEIAKFSGLVMIHGEKAESFVNRILESKGILEGYGMTISEDIQCMGRLVDGLLGNDTYKVIGAAINVAHGIDWKSAVQMLIAEDIKQAATISAQREIAKSVRQQEGKSDRYKRRGEGEGGWTKVTRRNDKSGGQYRDRDHDSRDRGQRQQTRGDRNCHVCGKSNHLSSECNYRKKTGCFKCGSEDHRIANCPKLGTNNKGSESAKKTSIGKSKRKHEVERRRRSVDSSDDEHSNMAREFSRMARTKSMPKKLPRKEEERVPPPEPSRVVEEPSDDDS